MPILHKEGFWIFSLLHRIFSTRNYCIRSDVPIDHAQYQGWNIGVEHRNIFHPYELIWLVRFTRLCNKYIYITWNLDWTPQCGARFARPIIPLSYIYIYVTFCHHMQSFTPFITKCTYIYLLCILSAYDYAQIYMHCRWVKRTPIDWLTFKFWIVATPKSSCYYERYFLSHAEVELKHITPLVTVYFCVVWIGVNLFSSRAPHIHFFSSFAMILLVVWSANGECSALTSKASFKVNLLNDYNYRWNCVTVMMSFFRRIE